MAVTAKDTFSKVNITVRNIYLYFGFQFLNLENILNITAVSFSQYTGQKSNCRKSEV